MRRLNNYDLTRIIRRVISEQQDDEFAGEKEMEDEVEMTNEYSECFEMLDEDDMEDLPEQCMGLSSPDTDNLTIEEVSSCVSAIMFKHKPVVRCLSKKFGNLIQ